MSAVKYKPAPSYRRILVFLVIAFAWSWCAWFLGLHYIFGGLNNTTARKFITCFFVGVYGPTISAFITKGIFDGFRGILDLIKKLFIWKTSPLIYLTIVFLPIVISATAIGFYSLFYGNIGRFDTSAFKMIPLIVWAGLRAGPLGEEMGWRGFLLPELQHRFSPFKSSLIIGLIWCCWHIPLFFAPFGTAVSGAPITVISILYFWLLTTCLACIYTWLVNRSNGSVLIGLLIHLSFNASLLMLFFPGLADYSKLLNYLSAPAFIVITVLLGFRTKFK